MSVHITVPNLGESIVEAAIEKWQKQPGEWVARGETVVVIESDKAAMEVPAPVNGFLRKILKGDGASVAIDEVIGEMEEAEKPAAQAPAAAAPAAPAAQAPVAPAAAAPAAPAPAGQAPTGPAARRAAAEHGVSPASVAGTGPGGRILKEDVMRQAQTQGVTTVGPREEQEVPMTPLRRTIARRLVQATQETAMLTTFNEVDMSKVMAYRSTYQKAFTEKYGIKLGFMSFFIKAAIEALKEFPAINGEIRDDKIVYKNYFDIGVAIGGGRGLTVPVIRNADTLSFAQTEQVIAELAERAVANRLKLEELQGGTFTITNGGIYGSMLSTPILHPPQSGILGMHNIVKRAVVVGDEIVVRPMMYLALSYDHRIVDGKEAVQFLVRIKDCIENPERILLEV
jgi:2-oxoglutarate dehydrogenase E2 component (dihydrolipoamide succinyltransferase)